MLDLGAEQNDLRVPSYLHCMAGRPIEDLSAGNGLLPPILVSHGNLPFDQVAPMRRLAKVIFQTLQERRDVGSGAKREILAGNLSIARRLTEVQLLSFCG